MERCGAPTQEGSPCRWPIEQCPVASHARVRATGQKPQHAAPAKDGERRRPPVILEGIARRDIAGTGWSVAAALADGSIDQRDAAVFASILRVLLAAGSGGIADDDALREIELRGLLMHGLPPRDEDEWELLKRTFSPEAVREVVRWQPLLEGDAFDAVEPGWFLQPLAPEGSQPIVADGDDD